MITGNSFLYNALTTTEFVTLTVEAIPTVIKIDLRTPAIRYVFNGVIGHLNIS